MTADGSRPPPPAAPEGGGGEPGRPLLGLALWTSLLLSALTLAAPAAFGPLGPLAAGVLAFLGYRRIRAARGPASSRRLAAGAMTLALVLLVVQGMTMIRNAPAAAAWAAMRERVAEVESALRTGTAESAWELLSEESRSAGDHDAFVAALREASGALGPLVTLGESRSGGGDWERTGEFNGTERIELRLPMRFDATFARGRGSVDLEFVVLRDGPRSRADLVSLSVTPAGDGPDQKSKSSTPK